MNPSYPHRTTLVQRREIQHFNSTELERYQLARLNRMLSEILPTNQFYSNKIGLGSLQLETLDELVGLPFTFKSELIAAGKQGGFASNRTWPIESYSRFHRTSGTRGKPLTVIDTAADWQWWLESWQPVLDCAQVESSDRVVMAFSFGPFIGFWSAFDAVVERGCLVAPAGAMKTLARIELICDIDATLVFCTPSYALHLAEIAKQNQINLAGTAVRAIVVAGEPGGSIPEIRQQIESAWGARVIDHAGASEIGPWGFASVEENGVFVNEQEFIPEFISIDTGDPAGEGELSELVLTSLGRYGSPVIRYRSGDLVRPSWNGVGNCQFVLLQGGVLGRSDDMMIIRGVNVFPSSIEQILRSFPEIIEYRMTAFKKASLDQLKIEIEDRLQNAERVRKELQVKIGLRVDVETVPVGTLPRFEGKGKRFIDQR